MIDEFNSIRNAVNDEIINVDSRLNNKEHVEKRLTRNTTSNDVSVFGKGFVITGECLPFALTPDVILLGGGLLGTTYFDSIGEDKAFELFENALLMTKENTRS
ncbi:hypothetical protein F8M41_009056 [Gigaspora margarita]|uniref:Uncharacterized protein n=1 Tax=Gigaspora margarita TaxID=4874 RepID=A0A8H4AVF9_GIGMA|nr:hypothetical protein F8M41_009056 [Gigaspora margarita]